MDTNVEKTKKTSCGKIIKIALLVIALGATIAAFVFANQIFGENSVFNKDVSSHAFVNTVFRAVPDAIRTVQIITLVALFGLVIRWITNKSVPKNNRSITVVKLINSIIKWVMILIALLIILGTWGVNVTALVAGAGVLTLVVGLGAQSLVSDIVAGIFIVCEGDILVGDVVVIDGMRGTVQEIGIRTTKVIDGGGNIKIINNSEIKSVINQSKELSVAKCTVGVEYGDSLEEIEKIIAEELPEFGKSIPDVEEGPFYKGVAELGASSVNLLFIAKCKEDNLFQVQRDLNRAVKLMFDKHGINIPFPQIVINEREENKDSEK